MLEYRIPLAGFVSTAIFSVGFVLALILVGSGTSGRPRVLGVLGLLAVFGSVALQAANRSVAGVYGTHAIYYQVGSYLVAGCAAIGLVLLALAVATSRRAKNARGDR